MVNKGEGKVFNFYKTTGNYTRLTPLNFHGKMVNNLDSFLLETHTTAFLAIRNDTILYESYFNGHDRNTPCKAFSASKNVISSLIGIAINEGHIKSVDDPLGKYIPELEDENLQEVTIRDCLMLTSGIKSDKGEIFPWNDKVKIYYSPDLRKLIAGMKSTNKAKKEFNIEEYSPTVLGMVLERATGVSITEYTEKKIWGKLGMEHNALWVTDSKKNRFEVVNSGLVATPVDLAKFGRLFLNNGLYNNTPIIPESWIKYSTVPDTLSLSFWKNVNYYNGQDVYFNSMWWGLRKTETDFDFSANGHFGQRIYVAPSKNILILRFGTKSGDIDWTSFISTLVEKM